MPENRRYSYLFAGILVSLCLFFVGTLEVHAENRRDYLNSLNVGISTIIGPSTGASSEEAIERLNQLSAASKQSAVVEEEESDLVMVNVQKALNVRADATEESDKVGLLYKDCGGRILERKDGWTRLKSGELIGWASDDYLLFGEDAKAMANDVGNLIVTINTETLRVRKEPSTESAVYGLMAQDDEMDIIEVVNDEWISVDYDGEVGYVYAEYVNMDFHIDEGETIAAIKKREEEERQAKLKANQGAVIVGGDDTKLLAALIYCEAGCETYNGQLAVGAVVMNRVRSGAYPNTVSGVIFASGQFTPALNGKVARVYTTGHIPESCYAAARAAINGETVVGGATHFRRVGSHDGVVVDNQVFW